MLFLFLSPQPLCDTLIRPLWPSPYFSVIRTVDAAIICVQWLGMFVGNVTQSLSSNAAIFFYCRISIRISNIGKKIFIT